MIIPIGLDSARVSRVPWVSIALLAINVLVWLGTALSGADRELELRFRAVLAVWSSRPGLELSPEVQRRFGLSGRPPAPPGVAPAASGGEALRMAQEELDRLCAELVAAHDADPSRRWALVPARGAAQPGWLTHLFLHGGLGHLLGNMLVFALVVAPFLEDAWGRPFFLVFYLAGGAVAGLAQALPMGDSETAIVGASGAISACLGAFALRFAHRRVRLFYWLWIFFRGTFTVPVWAYAAFGAAMDLVGLRLGGTAAPVAYAAHLGGFVFGLAVAAAVRATGLERHIAPEGAVPWQPSLALGRAADARASGDELAFRAHLETALARDPDDPVALLELARLHVARFDPASAAPRFERLLLRRASAGDEAGARALVEELGPALDPARLAPAAAYRGAALLEPTDRARAVAWYEAAAAGGGGLAAKASLRAAGLCLPAEPQRALALAERAAAAEGAAPELRERARALAASLAPTPPAAPPARSTAEAHLLAATVPLRVVACRLTGVAEGGELQLVTRDGRGAALPPARVAAVAVGVVELPGPPPGRSVVVDLLLRPGAREERQVVRLAGHALALGALRPGRPPEDAFAEVISDLLARSGAAALPDAKAALGRPFARFADLAGFERACYGRRLGTERGST